MKTNLKRHPAGLRTPVELQTHEGGPAFRLEPFAHLKQVLNAHLLWEDTFYVDGQGNDEALQGALARARAVDPMQTAKIVVEARAVMNIRHASLWAAVLLACHANSEDERTSAAFALSGVVRRADEIAEALAMVAKIKGSPKRMPHLVRKVLSRSFARFDAYQLGKYKGEGDQISLRDAMFLTHPKEPRDLLQQLADGTLPAPDTWEVGLSAGGDKREVFTRLLKENRLGSMALLRNLRGMHDAGVDDALVAQAMHDARWGKVLPFRFIAALQHAPWAARMLDMAFVEAKASVATLGYANVLVDVSGSMDGTLSGKSKMTRRDAAAALALCWPGPYRLWAFGTHACEYPAFKGLAGMGQLYRASSELGHGTNIGLAVRKANKCNPTADFTVVVTDMQSHDRVEAPTGRGVMINVAPYENAVGEPKDGWTHLSGFSEHVYRWLAAESGPVSPMESDPDA